MNSIEWILLGIWFQIIIIWVYIRWIYLRLEYPNEH